MAGERFTDPSAFRQALVLRVPKRIRAATSVVYFDAVTTLHEGLVETTPVDKGYLRASLLASAPGVPMPAVPARPSSRAAKGSMLGEAAKSAAAVGITIGQAARGLMPLTLGYVAHYAPFVEDRVHMVARARRQWRAIVREAVERAKGAAGMGNAA